MGLGYRSLLTFDGYDQDFFRLVDQQIHSWLSWKRYDADLVQDGVVELAPGAEATRLDKTQPDGSRTRRFKLVEHKSHEGTWTVQVTTHLRPGRPPWVLTDVLAPDVPADTRDRPDRRWTAAPTFMRLLLSAADGHDGLAMARDEPIVLHADETDQVIDTICDPDRRGLVLVAGSREDITLDQWKTIVSDWVREMVGLAGAYVLDQGAAQALNDSLGNYHAVPSGALRTYLPEADPASEPDSRRHRIMTTRTLTERSPSYVRRVLGAAARTHVVDLPLPAHVRRIDQLADRWETEHLLTVRTTTLRKTLGSEIPAQEQLPIDNLQSPPADSITTTTRKPQQPAKPLQRPEDPTESDLYVAARQAVQAVFGDVEPGEDTLLELAEVALQASEQAEALTRAMARISDLRNQLHSANLDVQLIQSELEDIQIDHTIDIERLNSLQGQVIYLQRELSRAGQPEIAWGTVPSEEQASLPDSMSKLLERMGELRHVEFTGPEDAALDLDEHDPMGRIARKSWSALLALDDYAEARLTGDFTGNVHMYCKETPAGYRGWSAERHAGDEDDTTKRHPRYRTPRTLPVPDTVDPTGQIFMGAHFKIATIRMITPRIHYHDDIAESGKIYVGYIGKHLPNAQTN
ncbi:hypothetical protein ABZV93_04425 [Actinopolymorpha sp. NPDC004070]|uniref:hypothetical protein n=1 Tax=Actinopolymorpha sp. NPDC004070 TaxID=3154548 RepID=UPI0033AE04CF